MDAYFIAWTSYSQAFWSKICFYKNCKYLKFVKKCLDLSDPNRIPIQDLRIQKHWFF